MTVTELCFATSRSGELSPELKDASDKLLAKQDSWCASNLPSEQSGRAARGVAYFQQVEDPSVTMLTTQWSSVDAHRKWAGSPECKSGLAGLASLLDLESVRSFHLDTELFPSPGSSDRGSLLNAPLLGVGRWVVAADRKDDFKAAVREHARGAQEKGVRSTVVAGWRVDKESPDREELVVFSSWDSTERHTDLSEADLKETSDKLEPLAMSHEMKHYKRFL